TWKQEQYYMDLHRELEEYRILTMEIHHYQTRYRMLPKEEVMEFRKMADTPMFKDTKKPRSAHAKWMLHTIRGMYYITTNENKLANDNFAAAVKIMDENPAFKQRNLGSAVNTLGNYMITSYLLKEFNKVLDTIKQSNEMVAKNPSTDMKRRAFRNYFMASGIYSDLGMMDEAVKELNEMQVQVDNGDITLGLQQIFFYTNAAAIYIFRQEYRKSLQYTSKILNYPGIEKLTPDLYYYGRLYELINLMEMKDYDLLEYRIKSFHRYTAKRNSPYKFEKELTNFIRKILSGKLSYNQRVLTEALTELRDNLQKVLKDPEEDHATRYFDFIGWLDSKVNNITYAEMATKRAEKEGKR
ncbi:MAG TPA: hypothetical protein VK890_02635, partial [Bacteroidia bacterium]|nr:hypothetical protein [Bacteroidia bacterium]